MDSEIVTKAGALFGSDEIEIIQRMGADATPEQVQGELRKIGHERTIGSIKTKRQKLGIVLRGDDLSRRYSLMRRKWYPTEAIDEAIKKAFENKYERRGCIRQGMKDTGWSRNAVIRRAVELGVTKAKSEIPWTDAEEELVREMAWQSPRVIQLQIEKRFGKHRTESSVVAKVRRLKCVQNLDGLHHKGLEEALGVGQRTVDRWLDSGKIRGIVRFPENQEIGRSVWFFPNWEIRRFVLENLDLIDPARVEKHWFVDLIASGEKRGDRAAIAG